MGRPGTGGGGSRHSSGGHSSSRSSGGHRVGSSRPTGRGSSFSSGSSYHSRYGGSSFGHRGGRYGGHTYTYVGQHGRVIRMTSYPLRMLSIIMVLLVLFGMWSSFSGVNMKSTHEREKLESTWSYQNDCITDETGWIEAPGQLSRDLQTFYEKTGIQPYVYLRNYDASLRTDEEKIAYAEQWYDTHIDNEHSFLFLYFGEPDEDTVGYMTYVSGKQATSVMDEEAVQIFWNYMDRNWVNESYNMDDVIAKTFVKTGDVIMGKPQLFSHGVSMVLKICLVLCAIFLIVGIAAWIVRIRSDKKRVKIAEDEKILNTPLDEMDSLKEKYKSY